MSEAQIPANPLGTKRIGKLLRDFAIPGIISMVINSLYNNGRGCWLLWASQAA